MTSCECTKLYSDIRDLRGIRVVLLLAAAVIWFAGHIGRAISELKGKKTKRYEKLKVIEDLMIVNSKERIDY